MVSVVNFNIGDPEELPIITDNTGTLLGLDSGSVGVGIFSLSDTDIGNANRNTLLSDFRQLGGADSELSLSNSFDANGLFDLNFQEDSASTSDLTDSPENIYVFIGDALTLETSTLFAIVRADALFAADEGGLEGQSTAQVFSDTSTVLVGSLQGAVTVPSESGNLPFSSSLQLEFVPVPEPSSSALLGLGGLALILRRRR